jgi:hypothetical protein
MAKEKSKARSTRQQSGAPTSFFTDLFAEKNRGLLLDLFVFVANVFLMRSLTGIIIDLFRQVSAGDEIAKIALGFIFLSMWVLPALGAVLKRWHFHQRLKGEGKSVDAENRLAGCLFNPLFYFCLNLVLTSAVLTGLGELFFGKGLMDNAPVFITLVIAGLILTIFQTYLIYLYFSPPKNPPKTAFLKDPRSELLGDISFFVNMIFFQVFWNLITFAPLGPPGGFGEFAGRLFFLCFISLLIYFPPRMFYLAEDINHRRTWLTMLLANSPVILRVLSGTDSNPMMN